MIGDIIITGDGVDCSRSILELAVITGVGNDDFRTEAVNDFGDDFATGKSNMDGEKKCSDVDKDDCGGDINDDNNGNGDDDDGDNDDDDDDNDEDDVATLE